MAISNIIKVVQKSNKHASKSKGDYRRGQKDAQSQAGGALVLAKTTNLAQYLQIGQQG